MVKLVCTLVEICTKLGSTVNLSAKSKAVALKLSVDIVATYCIPPPHHHHHLFTTWVSRECCRLYRKSVVKTMVNVGTFGIFVTGCSISSVYLFNRLLTSQHAADHNTQLSKMIAQMQRTFLVNLTFHHPNKVVFLSNSSQNTTICQPMQIA